MDCISSKWKGFPEAEFHFKNHDSQEIVNASRLLNYISLIKGSLVENIYEKGSLIKALMIGVVRTTKRSKTKTCVRLEEGEEKKKIRK